MRRTLAVLAALSAAGCAPSEPAPEAIRPFQKVDIGHALGRALEAAPGAALSSRSGRHESHGLGEAGYLSHFEFYVEMSLPESETESFLRQLCRQLGIEVRARSSAFAAGFGRVSDGESEPAEGDGYRAGRCDYYAERDGFVGWLGVPEPVRDGETLRFRIVEIAT